jgi:protein O-mannosyl-transferase
MKEAWKSTGLMGALLAVLTVLAYIPAFRAGFIWDDDAYVTENLLLTGPDALRRIWFSAHHQSQYFPLVYTTLWLERLLWGLNPVGYHIVNVVLHGINALLVWAVLRRLGLPAAWLVAAIWAVHPVNVETVAWITELKNTQSSLFYLLALLAWMKFTRPESGRAWRFYLLALSACALALFSKTTACTLPAAMLLALWLRKEPIGRRRVVEIVPFLALGMAMALFSVWWEAHLGNYRDKDVGTSFSGLERLLIATRALWFYAGKLLWPADLAFSYARWEIDVRDPLQYIWLIGCLAVAALLWVGRKVLGRAPAAAVVFFVAVLSPLLGFVPLYTFRYSLVADHYQYLASFGLIALAIGAGSTIARRLGRRGRMLGVLAAAAVLLLLSAATWKQARIYRDQETLWRDTLAKNPNGWMPRNNLGLVLAAERRFGEAITEYAAALRIKPNCADAHYNMGRALFSQGNIREAAAEFAAALEIKPDLAEAHNNLGLTLARLGRLTDAVAEHQAALRLNPDNARAHNNLGLALASQGKLAEATAEYQAALRIKPDYVSARNNLAAALSGQGRFDEAFAEWESTVRIKPDFPEAHLNWADALASQGRVAEAVVQYRETLRVRAGWPPALAKLAWFLATDARANPQGTGEAVQLAERLCESTGCRDPRVLDVLAAAYAGSGRFDDAVGAAQKAVDLASSAGQADLARLIHQRLESYQAGRPYREGVAPTP